MPQRSGRHNSLLRADDALLVVVDMQEPFLRNLWERERVVSNSLLLIEAARTLRAPIVPTQQYSDRMGKTIPEIAKRLPSLCVPFDKLSFSCMGDPAFESEIARSGRRQILLCGVETHICIAQTALDLVAQGYQVHVAADAVSSRTESSWHLGLRRMERASVVISSTEGAIYEMLGEAGTNEFRELLALMK